MAAQDIRPKWWLLYLIFPILIGLFALDTRLKLSTRGHQIIQIGIILLIYELVHLWLKANARALSAMDRAQFKGNEYKKRLIYRLPDSEIKDTLSQTFEMDIIEAEFVSPLDEVRKN